jgi:TolB-like protein/DNA-binding winged helix-turn-helix (wHTH) protein/Tfp pilus assembly protein PilF
MSSPSAVRRVVRFGAFELDLQSGELRKRGLKTRLAPQAFQVLVLLLEHAGELVTREALRQRLWPADTFVDFDMGLASAVKKLRESLGDTAENPRFVETLPRRGYRFLAAVEPVALEPVAAADPVAPRPPTPRPWRGRAVTAAVVAAVLLALQVGGAWRWLFRTTRAAPAQVKSIAVLPLENLSGDASQDYFADGVTDALITDLAQMGLQVISRTSVRQYKGTRKPAPAIARELGVDAVVEGSVVRVGPRVRITAQLVHGATDRHLWARSYERELRDVLALQGEIAASIAEAIELEVRPGARPRVRPVDPEAYQAYLEGRFYWSVRETDGLFKAADRFQTAIAKDPTFAPAYSGLSDTYRLFDMHGLLRPTESMPRAEAAARKALALDDTLAEAHASLATVLFRYDWDWRSAEDEYRRALALDPSYAEAHRAYAIYLLVVGRPEAAVAEARRAHELSPLSPIVATERGLVLAFAGHVDEGIDLLEKTMAADPGFLRVYQSLALAYRRKGDPARALAVVDRGMALSSGRARSPWIGYAYGVAGRRREALAVLADLEKGARQEYVSPQSYAVVELGLGDRRRAMDFLEKAVDDRALEWLGFATEVTGILGDEPRFQSLRQRLGLPAVVPGVLAAAGRPAGERPGSAR